MMFWIVVAVVGLVAIAAYYGEGKGDDGVAAAFGAGGSLAVVGFIACLIATGIATDQEGTATSAGTQTYKIADKSQLVLEDDGDLEFTYEDDRGTLHAFDEVVDSIRYEGSKREVVVIEKTNYTVEGLFPWDLRSTGQKAIVK